MLSVGEHSRGEFVMRWRRWLLVVGVWCWATMTVFCLLPILLPLPPPPGVSQANFLRLQTGMTLQEAEAIIGQPAEEWQSVEVGDSEQPRWGWSGVWMDGEWKKDYSIIVTLDRAGRITDKVMFPVACFPPEPLYAESLFHWLGW
jgi:hypothetical protein